MPHYIDMTRLAVRLGSARALRFRLVVLGRELRPGFRSLNAVAISRRLLRPAGNFKFPVGELVPRGRH